MLKTYDWCQMLDGGIYNFFLSQLSTILASIGLKVKTFFSIINLIFAFALLSRNENNGKTFQNRYPKQSSRMEHVCVYRRLIIFIKDLPV
jgi:hypothetical protein